MQCHDTEKYIPDSLTGTLEPREHAEFERHLQLCASCRVEYEEIQEMWGVRKDLPSSAPDYWRMRARFNALLTSYKLDLPAITGGETISQRRPARNGRRVFYAAVVIALFVATVLAAKTGWLTSILVRKSEPPAVQNPAPAGRPRDPLPSVSLTPIPGSQSGTVKGTLTIRGSSEPMVNVRIQMTASGRQEFVTQSDNDGNFEFSDVPPGKYYVVAQAVTEGGFEVRRADGLRNSAVVAVNPGQTVQNVALSLVPAAVISGQILDANGNPATNVNVRAFHLRYRRSDGRPYLAPVPPSQPLASPETTDDRGNYRIYGLAPDASYYIVAIDPKNPTFRTLYPGTVRATDATAVPVKPRDEASGVNFKLQAPTTYSIKGTIVPPAGHEFSMSSVSFFLAPKNPDIDIGIPTFKNVAPPDDQAKGQFELRGIVPGEYDLFPVAAYPNAIQPVETLSVRTSLVVAGQNIDGLNLNLRPGIEIRGRVVMNGASMDLRSVRVELRAVDNLVSGPSSTWFPQSKAPVPVDSNGGFTIPNRVAGRYEVIVSGMPGNSYVYDIRSGNSSVYESGLTVTPEPAPLLEIELHPNGGRIDGVVSDALYDNILLIPVNPKRRNAALYRAALSPAAGTDIFNAGFSLPNVPPGQYKIYAVYSSVASSGGMLNAAFMARYEKYGQLVTVLEASSIHLTLQHSPDP